MNIAGSIQIPGDGRLIIDQLVAPFMIAPEVTVQAGSGLTMVTVTIPCVDLAVTPSEAIDDDEVEALAARARLAAKGPQRAT